MTHPRLKHLVKSLPAILIQDRAPKTVSTYVHAYEAWRTWAVQCEAAPLPADPTMFSLYLVHLIQQDRSVSCINSDIYGASWVHKKSGYQQLSDHPLVQQVAEAARRILFFFLREGSLLGPQVDGGLWKPAMLRVLSIASSKALCLISRWLLCSRWVSLASFAGMI